MVTRPKRLGIWLPLGGGIVLVIAAGVLALRPRATDPAQPERSPLGVSAPAEPPPSPDARPRNPMELQQLSHRVRTAALARADAAVSDKATGDENAVPADEAALMAKLHALGEMNPALTIRLARAGNQRNPDSADAPERAWMLVKAMVNQGRFDDARAEAAVMVEKYRGTSWASDIERHMQVHPRPVEGDAAP